MFVVEAGSEDADGVEVTIEVVRERRGRSPRSTGVVRSIVYVDPGRWCLTIHQYCFRDVIGIVPRDHMLHTQSRRPAIQRLSSEYATVCAVPFLADLLHHLVHRPPIQLAVSQYGQVHAILFRISLHGFQTVIPVASDSLVDRQ
jgi:hypothetical protein